MIAKDNIWLTDFDLHLLGEGTHYRSFEKLGSHPAELDGGSGVYFAVWAPHARKLAVVGDFNHWDETAHEMRSLGSSGYWDVFVPGARQGELYKYYLVPADGDRRLLRADPFAFCCETPPRSASCVWDVDAFRWSDGEWMLNRGAANGLGAAMSVYQMHLGSWKKGEGEQDALTYRKIASQLPQYLRSLGYTHVEFLPLTEYWQDELWGFEPAAMFAPTGRFGTPQDLMFLVDALHQQNIGVIFCWDGVRFDSQSLGQFDGTALYEHGEEAGRGLTFCHGRRQVANFLLSSALFWLEKYHFDGLHLHGVSQMLYLPRQTAQNEAFNQYGGRENLEGIQFVRRLNEVLYQRCPDIVMIAEESSGWPMVSRPTFAGGLGFGLKWNTEWVGEFLSYMAKDPIHRSYHHKTLTSGVQQGMHENFILAVGHEEVVQHKGSLMSRMPGDVGQKCSNLRLLFAYLAAVPGKKLMFMGAEIGQWREWDYSTTLDWNLLDYPEHLGIQLWVRDLNCLLRGEDALTQLDFEPEGFCWIDFQDHMQSVVSFVRRGSNAAQEVLCVFNFTPVPRFNYRVGIDRAGYWEELLNSDSRIYAGSDIGNSGGVCSEEIPFHGQAFSLNLTLPPLAALFFRLSSAR